MRDIADTLAFLAIKTLIDGGFDLGPDRKDMRRTLSGAFEDLLNRLPEGVVPVVDPLGYVVLGKIPSTYPPARMLYRPCTGVAEGRDMADGMLDALRNGRVEGIEQQWHGHCEYVLGEVREVQP